MALQGTAFLALWNDVEPAREAEYETWHATEHVPERVSIPGMRAARRYIGITGEQHRYFTLYDATGLDVFASAPYLAVAEQPTAWSLAMRPSLQNFHRQPCTTALSTGFGLAAHAAAVRFRTPGGTDLAADLHAWSSDTPGVAALHLGVVDSAAHFPVPNASRPVKDGRAAQVVVVEAGFAAALTAILDTLVPWLATRGARHTEAGRYSLISALRHDEVDVPLWQIGRQMP